VKPIAMELKKKTDENKLSIFELKILRSKFEPKKKPKENLR